MLALWLNGSVRERVEGTSVDARGNTARQNHDMGAAGSRDAEQREVQARGEAKRCSAAGLRLRNLDYFRFRATQVRVRAQKPQPYTHTTCQPLAHKLLAEVVAFARSERVGPARVRLILIPGPLVSAGILRGDDELLVRLSCEPSAQSTILKRL